jgi:hypothetical protein
LELDGIVHALPRLVLVHRKLQGLEISSRSNYPNLDRSTGGAGDEIEVDFLLVFKLLYMLKLSPAVSFRYKKRYNDTQYKELDCNFKQNITYTILSIILSVGELTVSRVGANLG